MDVHVRLDGQQDLSGQIYRQVRAALHDGLLRPGDRLPATRELARRLAVARNTVAVAYERLTAEGYTAVLGTNCEQSYERYLHVGEHVRVTTALDSVVGPKSTAMGEGYFVTSRNTWYVRHENGESEKVATMLFRVLKFIPKEAHGG